MLHGREVVVGGIHAAQLLGLALEELLGVVEAAHALEYAGAVAHTAVGDGRAVLGQLYGGEQAVGLADAGLDGVAVHPGVHVVPLVGVGVGHVACRLAYLYARRLAQAELGGVLVEQLYAHAVGHGVEEEVAGVAQRLGDVVAAVHELAVGLAVDPALRRVALVDVLGVDALALIARLGVDYVLAERGDGRAGLEGGAGGRRHRS